MAALDTSFHLELDHPPQIASPDDLREAVPRDLVKAVRHHRRALAALEGTSFQALSDETTHELRERLEAELNALVAELRRRRGTA